MNRMKTLPTVHDGLNLICASFTFLVCQFSLLVFADVGEVRKSGQVCPVWDRNLCLLFLLWDSPREDNAWQIWGGRGRGEVHMHYGAGCFSMRRQLPLRPGHGSHCA